MTQTLTVSADGTVVANFGQEAAIFFVGDVQLPANVAAVLSATHANLVAFGGASVHMERDAFRAFTHTRRGSEVVHESGTPDPAFDAVMAAKEALLDAFDPSRQIAAQPEPGAAE